MRYGRRKLTKICGARNRRGLPCQCKLLLKGGRCKFHGGMSTGAKTPEGKARALANLRRGRSDGAMSKVNALFVEADLAAEALRYRVLGKPTHWAEWQHEYGRHYRELKRSLVDRSPKPSFQKPEELSDGPVGVA